MRVLVDTSVWLDYFRGTGSTDVIDRLIEENLVATNELILAEIIPPLHLRKEKDLISLMDEIKKHPISIDWDDIIRMQIICLQNGINGVGIPDLLIAQNAIQNQLYLLANDKHFTLMSEHIPLTIYRR